MTPPCPRLLDDTVFCSALLGVLAILGGVVAACLFDLGADPDLSFVVHGGNWPH